MSYNLLAPFKIIDAVSMGGNITSTPVEVKLQDNVGIQLNWSGAPVGTFDIQISSDYKVDIYGNVVNSGHWVSIPLSPSVAAAGSADSAYIDLNQMSANYVRIVYTRTSGTGSLEAWVTAKGV